MDDGRQCPSGDVIIASGTVGDHGIAILSFREVTASRVS